MPDSEFLKILEKHRKHFHAVVRGSISPIDLSVSNHSFNEGVYADIEKFSAYIESQRLRSGTDYLAGGYREIREMYSRSKLFDGAEPRSVHLGIDIWGS